jgi:hypothetical protein
MHGDLEATRAELRRLGYLTHGVERFLLQDTLRPRGRVSSALRLASRVALLGGLVVAPAVAVLLAAANGNLQRTPGDLLALSVHLLVPATVCCAIGFLLLQGILALLMRWSPYRGAETWALALAPMATAIIVGLVLWRAGATLLLGPSWQRGLVALVGVLVVAFLVRVLYDGLLAFGILLTERAPRRALVSRRVILWAVVAAVVVMAAPALLPVRGASFVETVIPTAPGERVALLAIDGVLPQELEYFLEHGDLPEMARLRASGGVLLPYRRPDEVPAAFWTSIATGLASPLHGVAALDTLRPLGVSTPLAQSGPLRPFFARVEVPLGLAEYRPMLANRRSAFTFWELAARGGSPILAVNWWATFPAEPLPGLVVAHGAYQLLSAQASSVVAPAAAVAWVSERRTVVREGAISLALAAALPAAEATALAERALLPDRFHRDLLRERLAGAPLATAVYLPALDLAADGWTGSAVAWSDLVRGELREVDELLRGPLRDVETITLVFDPGRRGGDSGRVLLWRRAGCAGSGEVAPEAIASGLMAALGLPRSRELSEPPAACVWPEPAAVIASYGVRREKRESAVPGEEYLRSLRALGYL